MSDPVAFFRDVAARHPRCFWLDGGGAREWSGRRSIIGWLEPDDVSLSYDAVRREVTRHVSGSASVVGDDPFVVLADELAAGDRTDQWFGYFGYACRPDLPAHHGGPVPDAVWMRPRHVRLFDHEVEGGGGFEARGDVGRGAERSERLETSHLNHRRPDPRTTSPRSTGSRSTSTRATAMR